MRKLMASATLALAIAAIPALQLPAWAADPSPKNADPAKADAQAEVPVKEVVLFSSGVGYFEHFGSVKGDGSTELRFKTQQINDVLKSLILQDLDGGKVTTITYPSQDPIEKTLRSFQVDITGNPSLSNLLTQLRGAKVTVTVGAEKATGTILGVELKESPTGEDGKPKLQTWQLNLLTGEGIRSIALQNVGNIHFEDPELRDELDKALEALSQARDKDKKPVTIHFRGQGERHVRIGYVVETPIWKTSYRLVISDDANAAGAEGKPDTKRVEEKASGDKDPLDKPGGDDAIKGKGAVAGSASGKLQGWAIVENQTDSDWNDVQLSLVSGRPISFIQDLYQPLYIPRPVVQPELYASLRPQTYEGGLSGSWANADFDDPAVGKKGYDQLKAFRKDAKGDGRGYGADKVAAAAPRAAGLPANGMMLDEAQRQAAIDPASSVSSVASATNLGELFQYTVGNVSLPRQKSAMIPIITDAVDVQRLSIYNQSVLAKNPLNGARLKNSTGKHLLQGPITVLENGTYAGDARIDDVPPGQERLVSFGIDQQLRVDADSNKQESWIVTGKIVKGVLQLTRKTVFTQNYLAQNKGDKDKTLLIEHPRRQGWALTAETIKPIETTEAIYRFQGAAPAGKQTSLVVTEEIVQGEGIEILPADVGTLESFFKTGKIPDDVKAALAKAIAMKYAMTESDRQVQVRRQQIAEITAEQGRIRDNMKTVQPNTDYYNRLAKKLNEQESRIETLQGEIESLMKKLEGQRKELETYVAGLNIG